MAVKKVSLFAFLLFFVYFTVVAAEPGPELTGTWTSKSRKVLTGPKFYDHDKDELKEPALPGISYSFSDDGIYEEAYYRATSDPVRPECAGGIMQFQHGNYTRADNGSLYLDPFPDDGRQLVSSPCEGKLSTYTLYNQTEKFKQYEIVPDSFNGRMRLNLVKWDGSPMVPMYLIYRPPLMVPTHLDSATRRSIATPPGSSKSKRDPPIELPDGSSIFNPKTLWNPDDWWLWLGIAMIIVGGILFMFSI